MLWNDCDKALEPPLPGETARRSIKRGQEGVPHLDESCRSYLCTQASCYQG